ncbi:MAG: translation initiation factor IF-2 N-terminal domain-containing protein [Lactococcus garvieae]
MRIYKLAQNVDEKSSKILELAQGLGFEVKTASSNVTDEEAEAILKELGSSSDEESPTSLVQSKEKVSFVEDSSSDEGIIIPESTKGKKKGKFSSLLKFKKELGEYEKIPQEPKAPKVKTVKEKNAKLLYRIVCIGVLLIFAGIANAAVQANKQVERLTQEVNATSKILNDNQKELSEQEKVLEKRLDELEKKEKEAKKAPSPQKAPVKGAKK